MEYLSNLESLGICDINLEHCIAQARESIVHTGKPSEH